MINKIYLFVLIFLLLFTSVNAVVEADYNFKLNCNANLKIACFDTTNALCTNATTCYITIYYPNNVNLVAGAEMIFGDNYYSYTVSDILLDQEGEYRATVNCVGAYNGYTSFIFSVAGHSLFSFDLTKQSNVVLLFVLVLLYLGLMILGFTFRNFGFASFGFFIGIIIGFMLSGLHIFLTISFILVNISIFYTFSKKNK